MKDSFLKRIDKWHLEVLVILVMFMILFPIIYLIIRDGNGSAIFPFHDQLDESILNYVFSARYYGEPIYEQMMCGVPAEGLKAFCPLFVPLYMIFDVYTAFEVQFAIVLISSFLGMYFCVKKLTDSSVSALISATVFSFLPIHSTYGNVVMGTPLLILSVIGLRETKRLPKILGVIGLVFYGLSTSMVLSGWAAMGFVFLAFVIVSIVKKKADKGILLAFFVLLITYVACNIDMFAEAFSINSFTSHREEFGLNTKGTPFFQSFIGILTNGTHVYEAETKHIFLFIPFFVAFLFLVFSKKSRELLEKYVLILGSIVFIAVLYAFFGTKLFLRFKELLPGVMTSFSFTRVYYFLPGLMYILLGISCGIVVKCLAEKSCLIAYILCGVLTFPSLLYIVKDKEGIFYQNINQINNGQSVTGYMTMRNIYSDELMTTIEEAIGKDMSTYRVVSIGISPVVSLMHGFYTIDGYSNNYDIEYKHQFREIIAEELELNDYNKAYFDLWGNRCYAFYHEWGNAYLLGKSFDGIISDLKINFDKMKEMKCRYIFSAGNIKDCEQYGLSFLGEFTNDESYWEIWVYEVE